MRLDKKILNGMFLLAIIILLSSFFSATYMSSNIQAFQFNPTPSTNFSNTLCQQGQDFIIQISPFGCTPAVVRSDLLEENDVPVFCQLGATKINPLIEVNAIDSISFTGQFSNMVSGIGFHPAKAALGIEGQLNTPVLSNIGYVVINLKKQANVSAIPEYVSGNLTANIKYNINNAFGIGKALFYLPEFSNKEDFEAVKNQYSFWNGRGYLGADEIGIDSASISLYTDNGRLSNVNLKKGETSQSIYLPGFECQAGLKIKLEDLVNPNTRAQLGVNAEVVEVAIGEKFLDNKCQVRNLQGNGLVRRVGLRCQEDTGAKDFDLTVSPKLLLNIGQEKEFSLGQKLYENGDKGIYLGYIGTNKNSKEAKDLFVYLVSMPQRKDTLTEDELSSISSLVKDLTSTEQGTKSGIINGLEDWLKSISGLSSIVGRFIASGQNFYRINFADKNQNVFGQTVSIVDFAGAQDKELSDNLKEQYDNAKNDYETIRKEFSSEVYTGGKTTFGEEALYKEIVLASDAGQKKTASDLCKEFAQDYPHSDKKIKECNDVSKLSSQEVGEVYVTVNKQIKKISFDGIYEPSFDDYGAKVMINSPQGTQYFDLRKEQTKSGTGFSLQLIFLEESSARVQISVTTSSGTKTEIANLAKDVTNDFEKGYSFTLTKINLKRAAKVSVLPNIDNSGTQANFTFKIGIEKRLINLPPDVIKQTIGELNKNIGQWNNVSDVLGKGIEVLKTSCLVTGAALVAKNLLFADGAGIARQYVMRGANGWFEKCAEMVAAKTYTSQSQCFADPKISDKIDADVAFWSKNINEQNSNFKQLEQGITIPGFLGEKIVNTSALAEKYSKQAIPYLQQNLPSSITDPTGKGDTIDKSALLNVLSYQGWKDGKYTLDQLKEIELYTKILNSNPNDESKKMAEARLYSVLSNVQTTTKTYVQITSIQEALNNKGFKNVKIRPFVNKNGVVETYDGGTAGSVSALGTPETPVQGITLDNKFYILTLSPLDNKNQYSINKVYDENYNLVTDEVSASVKSKYSYFQKYDSTSYNNKYSNAQIKYYETEPYKGLPAIVPFDLNNGWYAATKPTLPVGGSIASYDASGKISSFYLCNVGQNGIEEFQTGNDKCEMINRGMPYVFPGLSEDDAKTLITKAENAIEEASKISESQRKGSVSIAGQRIPVGTPAIDIPQFECQDFMSPKECLLLFNVCDPVICPSSRCDLGGAYPVKDVVQSGIIGSLALCFPNFQEGIAIPVCLTGVKAGLDGFLSVLTATRDCLQESLDTGKTVGVCDEIFSVYMCDFLWKQALPLADMIIPKIVEMVLGQNVKGGGEYLGVANAWSAAEKSVDYFTNYYATNSKQAFIARTTEGIQGEVCKSFISAVVPSGADFLSEITKPDSPSQFTGRFDETSLTTATVPPTSHYKVFYHIFAGKDSGAYYQVYLKGASGSSYYQDTSSNYNVASGYISVGGYASETKDFVATSGYRELCINVNGQEECGFKEVSTSFAINYISDQYLASQTAQTDIKTESNCISGSASAYSLLTPNAQSAAEELINPAIYNQGITRICATDNPGKGTDAYVGTNESRWMDVGYCDNTKIRCWLDTQSVKDVIKTTTIEGAALADASNNYLEVLKNQEGYLNKEQFSSVIEDMRGKGPEERISIINAVVEKIFWSNEKVQLLYSRGGAYSEIFRNLLKALPKPAAAPEKPEVSFEKPTPPEKVPAKELTKEDILKISDAGERMVAAANILQGTIVLGEDSKISTIGKWNSNCWTSMIYAYNLAGVSQKPCGYADNDGKIYIFKNEHTDGNTVSVTIGTTKRDGVIVADGVTSGICTLDSKTSSDNKLDQLQPGYLLSVLWNVDWAHNVIFLKWVDKGKRIAEVFDWNANVINPGEKDKNGKECTTSDLMGTTSKYCKIYRIYEIDLNDNANPVFMYWAPYIPSAASSAPAPEVPKESFAPPSVTNTVKETTTTSGPARNTVGEKIYAAAMDVVREGTSSTVNPNINDVAAKFVSRSLVNAGLNGIEITTSVSSLVSVIDKDNDFSKVDNVNSLKIGDVVVLGDGCKEPYTIGIVALMPDDRTKVYFYTNLKDKVKIENIPTDAGIDKLYIYKAYRYSADLSSSEKNSIQSRTKWNLDTSLAEVDRLLKLPGRNNGGTYIDNKIFVNQLIFDKVLTEKDCGDVRTYYIAGTGQKRMDWLKSLLQSKKASALPLTKYDSFKTLFEKYAKDNLPSVTIATSSGRAYTWNQNDFKALLVAVAQQNNWGASTKGGSDWLMGYQTGTAAYRGADVQIKTVSGILQYILNGNVANAPSYKECISTTVLNDRLHCILSVYYKESGLGTSSGGRAYADNVMNLWYTWNNYFNS